MNDVEMYFPGKMTMYQIPIKLMYNAVDNKKNISNKKLLHFPTNCGLGISVFSP